MNSSFSQWTRQTAFLLTLNQEAIGELLELCAFDADCLLHGKNPADYGAQFYGKRGLASYLMRRGLIAQNERGTYYTTKAGRLTAELLQEAGFEIPPQRASVFQTPPATLNQ